MGRTVLVGGSGFLGRALRERLGPIGNDVVVIGRGPSADHDGWSSVQWDAKSLGQWADSLEGADAIVHLAGKRVDARPTKSNIDELISSREGTVRLVGRAIQQLDTPPKAWIQMSSLAIFGDSGDEIIDETSTPPTTGLPQQIEVVQRWEAAYHEATSGIERAALLRVGIGIGGTADPTTRQLTQLAKLGLGGPVAGGRHWVSWIGSNDLFDLLLKSVTDPTMSGLYHLTSPNPIPNTEFMAAYRNAVGRSFGLPASRLMTTAGALLLGSDPALALTGRRCMPGRLLDEGYHFKQPLIGPAVEAAVSLQRS